MNSVTSYFSKLTDLVDKICEGKKAWTIVATTSATTVAVMWVADILSQNESITDRTKKKFMKLIRKIPGVQNKISEEINKLSSSILKDMNGNINNDSYITELPAKGWSKEQVMEIAAKYNAYGAYKWQDGYASGTVYHGGEELSQLITEIYGMSIWTNPLHTDVFPGIRKMEAEVVRMCCSMFKGGSDSCGTMTSGGTESIIMACKAYRNYAMEVKGIKKPEILVPVTAHAAFDKGAEFLNISIKHVPVDPKTMKVDIKAMERMITKNTCMLVGSAPQFPHGIIDPIESIACLARKYDIPLHVDACLGGFLIAFAADAGFNLPKFDFTVDGVTSISCDTHKYGFTPKGSSVVLYSKKKYRHFQFFVQTDWPGGIYATPAISGSRPGGIIAATWGAMIYYGREGYIDTTREILRTAKKLDEGCRKIPGIQVMGQPEVSVVAITSDKYNIYSLFDRMTKKGWNLNALQFPNCIHIAVTFLHTKEGVAERFIADVASISEELIKNPPEDPGESAAMYGLAQSLPDRSIVNEFAWCYLDACYSSSNNTPNGK
ncbi:Sphingosine-1-phosphate lyase [Armadillidium nasatum]|uniref:sphinganine-1-phosphate aldolase n=1 Tax=Armadillidium nasatum TaxID=96803 RepID=A0A5N5TFJ8_9CRUS|nr:Sphingosine-1-phosphate lyase [Armadillidium nasatum]